MFMLPGTCLDFLDDLEAPATSLSDDDLSNRQHNQTMRRDQGSEMNPGLPGPALAATRL